MALLPLGIVALLAALHTNRIADSERRADLRVAVGEATRKLGTELATDITMLKAATAAATTPESAGLACERLALTLGARIGSRPSYALFATDRAIACASPGFAPRAPVPQLVQAIPRLTFSPGAVTVEISDLNGRGAAVARYPAAALGEIVRPLGIDDQRSVVLTNLREELPLATEPGRLLAGTDSAMAPVGLFDLQLRATSMRSSFSVSEALQAFLPLLMWASAAIVGFFVVDRLLIRPLATVRAAVAELPPGAQLTLPSFRTPAREIRALAEALESASATRARHEEQIAAALEHQVRLTREVHHRVKNNLQVVASLISLHARSAPAGPAADAYAAIQRRVDALAIVHSNHFAALETNDGVSVRALFKDLTTSLRTSMAASGPAPPITIEIADVRVEQDVAVPIAFLVTELVETSMLADRQAPIAIVVGAAAVLSVRSRGFAVPVETDQPASGSARIVAGLARQLRSALDFDRATSTYQVTIPLRYDR